MARLSQAMRRRSAAAASILFLSMAGLRPSVWRLETSRRCISSDRFAHDLGVMKLKPFEEITV